MAAARPAQAVVGWSSTTHLDVAMSTVEVLNVAGYETCGPRRRQRLCGGTRVPRGSGVDPSCSEGRQTTLIVVAVQELSAKISERPLLALR